MYPDRDLIWLAGYKAALRRNMAVRRVLCAEAAARVTRPLAWLDRVLAFRRRLPPLVSLAVVPLGLLLARAVFPRLKIFGSIVGWSSLASRVARGVGAVFKAGPGSR